MVEVCRTQYYEFWKVAYPRRIIPPNGYCNPKYFGNHLVAVLRSVMDKLVTDNFVDSAMRLIAKELIKIQVPTYFPHYDFITDVAASKMESTMCVGDLKIPDTAMLFVLPDKFTAEYNFGLRIPFLAVLYLSAEELTERKIPVHNPPPEGMPKGVFLCHYQWYEPNDMPTDYVFSQPGHMSVERLESELGRQVIALGEGDIEALSTGLMDHIGMTDTKLEGRIMVNMTYLAAKLMLALSAEPELIEKGTIAHKAKFKGASSQADLWNPHLIGWKYRHDKQPPQGGSHASPRLHRRVGHFRDQAHGPELSLRKIKWIKPMWVGLKPKEEK